MTNLQNTLGLLNLGTNKLSWMPNITSTTDVAKVILKRAMLEEDLKFNDKRRVEYLNGWAEHMNENEFDERTNHEGSELCDHVADHLIYGNSLHIITQNNRTEISNDLRNQIYFELVAVLENSLTALKN